MSGALGGGAPEDVGMLGARVLTIVDDDPAPRALLGLSADPLAEDGGSTTVTAALDRPSSRQTTLTVQVAPAGSATTDHFSVSPSQTSHTFTFAAGSTSSSTSFTITAVDNDAASANRKVRLTGAVTSTNGVLAPAALDLLIADDEGTAPAAPTGLTATASGTSVVLGWTAPADTSAVTGYQVRVKAGDGGYGNWTDIPDSAPDGANATGYTLADLAGGVRHSFRVRAVSTARAGPQSDEASATPGAADRTAPVLSRAAVDWDRLTLTYGEALDTGSVPDATAYEVRVGTATRTVREAAIAGAAVVLSLSSPVAAGEPVRVTYTVPTGANATPVQDAAGNPASPLTGQVALNVTPRVTLVLTPAAIGENGGVAAVTATVRPAAARAFTLTVASAPARSEDFILSPNRRLSFAANQGASTGTVTVTALDNDLAAADAMVTVSGAVSASARVTGPADVVLTLSDDDEAPGAPALSATGGDRFVSLAWKRPASAGSSPIGGYQYRLKRVTGSYGDWTPIPLSAPRQANAARFAVAGLTNGTVYVFELRAVSAAGPGPASAEASAEARATPAVNAAPEFPDREMVRRVVEHTPVGGNVGAPVVATDADGERLTYTLGGADGGAFAIDHNSGQITAEPGTVLDYASGTTSYTVTVTAADPAGATDTATVTIEVLDVPETHLDLHLDPASITESGGVSTVSATLSEPAPAAFAVEVTAAAVWPAEARDFTLSADRTLSFTAGARASSGTVTVTAVNNNVAAAHKSVTVSGTLSGGGADVNVADRTLTILDDDTYADVCSRTAVVRDSIVAIVKDRDTKTCGDVTQSQLVTKITYVNLPGRGITSLQSGDFAGLTRTYSLDLSANRLTTLPADIFAGLPALTTVYLHRNPSLSLPAGIFAGLQLDTLYMQVDVPVTLERVSPGRFRAVVATGAPFTMTLPLTVTNGALPSGATSVTIPAGRIASGTLAVTRTGSGAVSVDLGTLPAPPADKHRGYSLIRGAGLPLEVLAASPRPVLVLTPATIPESGVATITAELDEPAPVAFDLTVSAAAGTNAVSGNFRLSDGRTLRFDRGATESTGVVTIAGVDNAHDDHRTKEVEVSAAFDGAVTGVLAPESQTLTLGDDDPPPVATLDLSDDAISENGGTATVTVELDRQSSRETLVDVSVTPDSPATTGDFSLDPSTAPHRITVPAWTTGGTSSLTITATDNAADAADRTLTVAGTVESGNGVVAPEARRLRIANDDASGRGPELVRAAVAGTTVTLTWDETLDAANPPPLSAFSVSAGGSPVTLSGAPAVSGSVVTLTLVTVPAAGRTVTVTYTDPTGSNDTGAVQDAAGNDAATVTNHAVTRLKTVTLVLSPAEIQESGASTITATLDRATSEPFTVLVSATPLSAAAGDFRLSAERTLRFAANETTSTGAVSIAGIDNPHDDDSAKTVSVTGTLHGAPGDVGTAVARTLTLTDDDPPPRANLRFTANPLPEDGRTTVTVALDRQSARATTVAVRVEPVAPASTGDFVLSPVGSTQTFTVDAGETAPTGSLKSFDIVAVDNNVASPDRKLRLGVEVTSNNGVTVPDPVELLIQDDEGSVPGAPTGLSATPLGSSIKLAWTAPASGGSAITGYQYRRRAGSGTYTGWTDIPDSEPPAVNAASYTLRGLAGGVEHRFQVRALNANGASAASDEAGAVLQRTLTLVLDPATITEGGVTTVSAVLDQPASAPFSVTVSVSAGSNAPADTAETVTLSDDPTLRFSKGARLSAGVTLSGVDNTRDDHLVKEIVVNGALGAGAPADVSDRIAPRTLSITDDDPAPRVRWMLSQDPLFEGGNKNQSFVGVELDRPSSRDTTFLVRIVPIAPATNSDFQVNPTGNIRLAVGAGDTAPSGFPLVTAVDNDAVSPNRKLRLTATNLGANGVVSPDAWELSIADDESTRAGRPASLSVTPRDGAAWLAWSHPADPGPVTGYQYRAVPAGQENPGWFDIPDSAPGQENATSYLVTGLSNGVEHTFRVRSVASGGGRGSNTVKATPVAGAADPEVTVSYDAASYTATEGGSAAAVTVTLSEAPGRRVAIPITKIYRGSASGDDYSGVPASLTFGVADTSKAFTVTATDDSEDDDGESLDLGFGPRLPEGVSDGTPSTATVSLADDDESENAVPTASDKTVETNEDTAYTFQASDFNFMDADTSDTLSSVKVVTLESAGDLELDGTDVAANAEVSKTDIDDGKLKFTPAADANGDGYATFAFKVSDGTAESADPYTMTIDVQPVNDAPTGKPAISGTTTVGRTLTADVSGIGDADGLGSPGWTYQWVRQDDTSGSGAADIASATAATYTLVTADQGKHIVVKASFTDDGRTAEGPLASDATAAVAATVPGAVRNLTASANGATRIDLSWEAPASDGGSAVTGYRVEVSDDGSTGWIDLSASQAGREYAHTGLTAGTAKHYRVSAINDVGAGPPATANATTAAGTLVLNVAAVTGDDKVNIAEKAAGFAIAGDTGSEGEVAVTVVVGTTTLTAESADADPATWSVSVEGAASYITESSVTVTVSAEKAGYVSPSDVERTLAVDLTAPEAPTYTAPGSLKVGAAITAMDPGGGSGIDGYKAAGLPGGLNIASGTGVISGTPTTASTVTVKATVTVSDAAGNEDTVEITFPAVTKGDQTLSGFEYSSSTVTFGGTAPTVTAPTGAETALSYSTGDAEVCTVDSANGTLTLTGVGSCVVTVTAASSNDWNGATATYTVTVQAAGTLVLNVAAVTGDDKVNIAEKAAGFAIAGDTGSEGEVAVTVVVGTTTLTAESADADPATWSVSVEGAASYITESSVTVTVSAEKAGYVSPSDVERTLAVDLTAPEAPTYTAPGSLKVGAAITAMDPGGGSGIDGYKAAGLPGGLNIASGTGVISGTPTTASTVTVKATVTVSDAAGNEDTVEITFPAVTKGDQTLSGFEYSSSTVTFGGTAPTVTAPTGAETALSYSTGDAEVCTVDSANGTLTLTGVGSCVVTVTAASSNDWNGATATYTVTVQAAGTLVLNVAAVTGDDKVNIAEKAAGFAIAGDTGSEGEVAVTVVVGTTTLTAESADADPATWSVSVEGAASYITESSVTVTVSAEKAGYVSPSDVERTLAVDLTAPEAPTYTAPGSLKVGAAITAMDPGGGSGIDGYKAAGLPGGLNIASGTGVISGTPTTASTVTVKATVTVSDAAGNEDTVEITFPAVTKGDQTLSGFEYSSSTVTFGGTAPTVTAPTGAETALSYSTGDAEVCTVDSANGTLTLTGVGSCVVTVTAASSNDWNGATATYTVTVQAAGTLVLNVAAVTGDDKVNIAEKAAGFAIAGDTGSEGEVAVTVVVGTTTLTAESADADPATWSVSVEGAASYITESSVTVTVSAEKAGYVSPSDVERTLAVDLTAPEAPTYTAPGSLKVGAAITAMDPGGGSGIDGYKAAGLPGGLNIASGTGVISGTPTTASTVTVKATVTVSDAAGNEDTVEITFPAVTKGDQTLSGFEYSSSTVTFGGTAPTVTAPTGAETALSYSTGDAEVCTVDSANGTLTLTGVGSCVVTVTAASSNDWNGATATYTVTVQAAGTLVLNVAAVTGDDKVNIAEKAAGFAIAGDTGSEGEVAVTVVVGTTTLTAESADADPATWSVSVEGAASYITESSVTVTVSAEKAGYVSPSDVERTLAVDLTAPEAPTYTAPGSLKVGAAITAMDPGGGSGIESYKAAGLPGGLNIASGTGVISGTPTTASTVTVKATVTASDAAGNEDTVEITFPAVTKGDQTLSGFEYSSSTVTFGGTAPTVTAPTGAETALSYSTGDAEVCTVDSANGTLTLTGVGSCVVTVTAASSNDWNGATATYTVTVQAAGTLVLNVAAVTGDDKVNIAEKAAGFAIAGDTGSEGEVAVTVVVGTTTLTAESADADPATWSVSVEGAASYITESSVTVTVSAEKAGYVSPSDVERTLAVDLTAPEAPTYTAPGSLKVGAAITAMDPGGGSGIESYKAAGLPGGLNIASGTGVISGTPTTASTVTVKATVTVSDAAGNEDTVEITFPAVTKGDQTLSGFEYSSSTVTVGATAPTVTAPTGAETALTYSSGNTAVCTVNSGTGALTPKAAGSCKITVTAASSNDWNGATATYTVTVQAANTAPSFGASTATRTFTETVGSATVASAEDIGAAVAATDAESDSLAYTLEGTDKDKFTIDGGSGQIRTKVGESYDRESDASHAVTVKADDGKGGTATIAVTLEVANAVEKPLAPSAPSVAAAEGTELTVRWTAPANAGRPAITSYDVRYRGSSDKAWTDGPQDVTGTSASLTGLTANEQYLVQVRATNSDGDGAWSGSGAGRLGLPGAPAGLMAAAGDAMVKLAWTAPEAGTSPVTGYQYQRKEGSGSYGAWTATDHGLGVHQTVSGLTNATAYTFRVRAVNAVGAGAASAEATATPDTAFRPVIVSDSTGEQAAPFRITITFNRDVPELRRSALVVRGGSLQEHAQPASPRMSQADGREWTAHVAPAFGFTGWLTIDIPAGAVRDKDGRATWRRCSTGA